MSAPADGTREQSPDKGQRTPLTPVFAAGNTVPNLSSWILERKLGGGGFGEVWLARHAWNTKEKPRAVKFCTDPAARHRLVTHERNVVLRVMKYASDHPNVVPLLDCNLDGNIPWLMYEFVEGGTLANLIEEWRNLPLPERLGRVVRVLHAIAGALAKFHRFDPPLVHRDMKPQNVLMAGDTPRISDFGIGSVAAQPTDGATTHVVTAHAARLPSALHNAGTRLYAPPEQLCGSPPNPRDDVYALGIIAYQMLTTDLTTAPGADTNLELCRLKVPGELVSLIVRSIAVHPERRPKDAAEWETVLAPLLQKVQVPYESSSDTDTFGSKAVLLPEPDQPPRAHRGPPPIPPPVPLDLPLETEPAAKAVAKPERGAAVRPSAPGHVWAATTKVAKAEQRAPMREKPANKRRFALLLVGGTLFLGLGIATGLVYLLTSGNRPVPTTPAEHVDPPKPVQTARHAPVVIRGDHGDGSVDRNGRAGDLTLPLLRVGTAGDDVRGHAVVHFFALPAVPSRDAITGAELELHALGISQGTGRNFVAPRFHVDLYGLGARATPVIEGADYHEGPPTPKSGTLLRRGVVTPTTAKGRVHITDSELKNYVLSIYQMDGKPTAAYVVFRVNADTRFSRSGVYQGYEFASADNTDEGGSLVPKLILKFAP